MGEPINLTFESAIFANYCFTSFQQLAVDLVDGIAGETEGDSSFFNFGNTTPAPDDRDKPWIRTNADGTPDKIYVFVNGAWTAKHPLPTSARILYGGTEGSIDTFDGGEAGTITATTGPMWQKVSAADAKFLMGPGTLPSTTVVAVGSTGGEEKVTLLEENLPVDEIQGYTIQEGANLASSQIIADDDRNSTALADPVHSFGGDATGATVAHNNLPPYVAMFVIERTARSHYRI